MEMLGRTRLDHVSRMGRERESFEDGFALRGLCQRESDPGPNMREVLGNTLDRVANDNNHVKTRKDTHEPEKSCGSFSLSGLFALFCDALVVLSTRTNCLILFTRTLQLVNNLDHDS